MTLEEAIKHAEEVAEENQKVVDTGIVFDDVTIDMLYCDDTEVIEEHLANYQMCADEHRQLAEWLKDYKQLLDQKPCNDAISREAVIKFVRSLTRWCVRSEDGKFNNVGLLYDDVMFGIDRLQPVKPQEPKTVYIPEGATNGDVIKAMFSNARVCNIYPVKDDEVYYVSVDNAKGCTIEMRVIKSWWNTPYKESEG